MSIRNDEDNFFTPPDITVMDVQSNNWMATLGDKLLYDLLIPGTHDSGTEGFPVGSPSRTQYYKINEQLQAGVRFLDMRLAYNSVEDNFHVVHGSDVLSYLNFDTVVKWCADFLSINPTETIVMSIKQEGAKPGSEEAFATELSAWHNWHAKRGDWKADLWYTTRYEIPTVAQAKSKIVLLRRYEINDMVTPPPLFYQGLDLAPMNQDKEGYFLIAQDTQHPGQVMPGVYCSFQDQYQQAGDTKKTFIAAMLKEMVDNRNFLGHSHRWFLNFVSTSSPGPLRAANEMNPWLESELNTLSAKIYGVLLTDYAQPRLWQQIYALNFRH